MKKFSHILFTTFCRASGSHSEHAAAHCLLNTSIPESVQDPHLPESHGAFESSVLLLGYVLNMHCGWFSELGTKGGGQIRGKDLSLS